MNDLLLTRLARDRLHELQRGSEERALLRMALRATAPVRTPAPTPAPARGTVRGSPRAGGIGRFLLGARAGRPVGRAGIRPGAGPDGAVTAIASADACCSSPSSGVCCGTAG